MTSLELTNFIHKVPLAPSKGLFKEIKVDKSHCLDLDLNDIRPGIASDGNFSSYLIGRS